MSSRRFRGRQSPSMRRWSIMESESTTQPFLDWVRDQREENHSSNHSVSQSVHGGRSEGQPPEERMTESAREIPSREHLDDIRRNPMEMEVENAPLAIVNVTANNDEHSTMRTDQSLTNDSDIPRGMAPDTLQLSRDRLQGIGAPAASLNESRVDSLAAEPSVSSELVQHQMARTQNMARAATQSTRMQVKQSVAQLVVATSSVSPERQPDLIPSNTDDSDDVPSADNSSREPLTLRDALGEERPTYDEHSRQEAITYLLQYETMVLQQEAEEIATMTYIRPLLERLQDLGQGESRVERKAGFDNALKSSQPNESLYKDICQRSITYGELKQALQVLETESSTNFLTRDKQLMMILKLLTEKHASLEAVDDVCITWAEIIHCYRVCILGMSTLKQMPKEGNSRVVRSRAKDRILSQLSLFELPATKLLNEESQVHTDALDVGSDHHLTERRFKSRARRLGVVGIVTVCVAAAALGFLAGSSYNSVADSKGVSIGDEALALAPPKPNKEDTEMEPRYHVEYCPARAPEVHPEHFVSNFARGSASANFEARSAVPQFAPTLGIEAMPVAVLNQTFDDFDAMDRKGKAAEDSQTIWQSISPEHQRAASAVLGASAGVLAPALINALSLSSLGVLPAGLVVVGALAVGVNLIKGIHFFLRRLLKRA